MDPKRADCFSMGVVFHQILTGFHPFGTGVHRNTNIVAARKTLLIDAKREADALRLLTCLLSADPMDRPANAGACLRDFRHFFHGDAVGEMLCAQVRFWADYLGGGFEGYMADDAVRPRLRDLAGTLSRAVEARLEQDARLRQAGAPLEWFRLVELPPGTRPWAQQRSPKHAFDV